MDEQQQVVQTDSLGTLPVIRQYRSVDEMLMLPSPTFLPGGKIPSLGVSILAGAPAAGKTLWALRHSVDLAREGLRVLYVPAEDESQFRPRLKGLKVHLGDDWVSRLHFWYQAPVLDGDQEHAELRDALSIAPVDLLVIDTLSAAAGLYDEMKPEEVMSKIRLAAQLGESGKCAVLALPHTGWNTSRVMGSSAIRRELRASYVIEKYGGKDERRLSQDKNRIGPEQDPEHYRILSVNLPDEEGTGPVLVTGDGAGIKTNQAKRLAMEFYNAEGKLPTKAMLCSLGAPSEGTAQRALFDLRKDLA